MKTLIWEFFKIVIVLVGVEIFIFILMLFFVMSDQPIGFIGKSLGIVVRYVLGFPLVLIDSEYPFYMNSSKPPSHMIPLIILNLFIQTGIILFVKKFIKW